MQVINFIDFYRLSLFNKKIRNWAWIHPETYAKALNENFLCPYTQGIWNTHRISRTALPAVALVNRIWGM